MKRIAWVDIAKYICIMAVMLEHLESITDELSVFFSPFFVLCFFVVAGYTHKPGQDFKSFFMKKVRTLFVPWLIFSVLDITVSQLVSFSAHASFLSELGWNFLQIRSHGDQIWFVAALFITFIPFYFFIEWYNSGLKPASSRRTAIFVIIALLLFTVDIAYSNLMDPSLLPWGTTALPWHLEYIFQAMFYMTLGYMFRQRWEAGFDRHSTPLLCLGILLLYLFIVYLPYFADIPNALFSISAIFITPLIGILLVIAYSKVIPPNRYILYVGQNTLIYFALHGKAFSFIQVLLSRYASGIYSAILSNAITSNLFAVAFTFLLSFILLIPAYIINRWFPFIVGRKKTPAAVGA